MSSEYNFFQHWYPISPVEDLEISQPTAITILGLSLVIWKNKNTQKYQVFLDQCPHRLAPLSEGRIDEKTGNLMCSYHGWEFDEEGICTRIPQAENKDLVTKNKEHLCVLVFPSREVNDLLWVWLDPKSLELAEKTPLPLSPQIDTEKGFVWSSFVRDLEYDWETLLENVADPSHVPFAHHGVQGNREKAVPIPIEITKSDPELIEAQLPRWNQSTITFEPPCRLEYEINLGQEGKKIGLITYCIPVAPGKSRIVAQFSRNFAKTLHHLIPRWWAHIKTRNLVLDGDMILLHQQEKFLQQRLKTESWKTAYKLVTSADRLVIEFRQWFDTYCQGKLPWDQVSISASDKLNIEMNIPQSRQEILNRYRQHTQHCHSCRNALKNTQTAATILLFLVVIIAIATATMPDDFRLKFGLPLMVFSWLGLGVYSFLKLWLEPKFYFVDYIHAEKK